MVFFRLADSVPGAFGLDLINRYTNRGARIYLPTKVASGHMATLPGLLDLVLPLVTLPKDVVEEFTTAPTSSALRNVHVPCWGLISPRFKYFGVNSAWLGVNSRLSCFRL